LLFKKKAKEFLDNKKDVERCKNCRSVSYSMSEKFICQEGNATKRMEFFLKGKDELCMDVGLKCKNPSRGPMNKVLKYSHKGDTYDDIWNLEV